MQSIPVAKIINYPDDILRSTENYSFLLPELTVYMLLIEVSNVLSLSFPGGGQRRSASGRPNDHDDAL